MWYHSGLPPVVLRWVLIRDPKGRFEPQALLSTNPTLAATQIVGAFVRRWAMEVTFQEVRTHSAWRDNVNGTTWPRRARRRCAWRSSRSSP